METLQHIIQNMINVSPEDLEILACKCSQKSFKKKSFLTTPDQATDEVFFITKGLVRLMICDLEGNEHSIHFALENQWIADYTSFLQNTKGNYYLQAMEPTEAIVMNRDTVNWCYQNTAEGEKMGRLIAEHYFKLMDNRIQNLYCKSPVERYKLMDELFPGIHNRIPQHMIASYIGISPVHLSRIKKLT